MLSGGDLNKPGQPVTDFKVEAEYKYTGQRQVKGIGLYYYNARFYDPEIGRFIREDSYDGELDNPQSQNIYIYVMNNPLKYVDPTGHWNEESDWYRPWSWLNKSDGEASLEGKITALGVDFLPLIGDGKGIIEAFTGEDVITKEKLVWWERGLGLICLTELRGIRKGAKYSNEVIEAGTTLIKGIDETKNLDEVAHIDDLVKRLGVDVDNVDELIEESKNLDIENTSELAGKTSKKLSKRLKYMGSTPSKSSQVGKEVIKRMAKEGKVRKLDDDSLQFLASDDIWYDFSEADMAHKVDAVSWWSEIGRFFGAKSDEVRKWMKDPDNYYLDHFSINRSQGAN